MLCDRHTFDVIFQTVNSVTFSSKSHALCGLIRCMAADNSLPLILRYHNVCNSQLAAFKGVGWRSG